jgi:predicted ArsR family transcriptional regulator
LHPVRQKILDYLKRQGQATVTELADYLEMAPVSVRHHLDLLIGDNLVETSRVRRQARAGRPTRLYALTDQADSLFPNNYQQLARESLDILKRTLPPDQFIGVMTELANKTADRAPQELKGLPPAERLQTTVQFLNDEGYMAFCECEQDEILLHTCHCPYKDLVGDHPEICQIDHVLIRRLTGMTPLRVSHMTNGGVRCTYKLIPMEALPQPDPLPEIPAHV